MQYLQTHQVTPMLNAAVNELAKAAPAEPYSFLINSLLKAAAAKGVETAFEQRMKSIQATLEQEQAAAQAEVAALKKRIAELEGGAPAGRGGGGGSGGITAVPLGHTPFSWNGGLAEGADVSAETSFSMLKAPPVKKAAAAAPAKKAAAPAAPAAAAAKKQPEKAAGKGKPAAKEAPKEAPKDEATLAAEAAAKAAKDREKFLAKIVKEGGKKGVEIEGASDMGGLDFFCTTMELPDGDTELLLMAMDAMNADPDPEAEDRKGCSGHVGKMIYSAGVTQLAIVAYVPDAEHNKSASKIDVQVWMDHVLKTVGGGKVLTAKKAANSPKGGHIVVAAIPGDADKGKFPLKDKDSAMAAAFDYLRKHDAFPEDKDSSDEMVFGDDDNLDDYM